MGIRRERSQSCGDLALRAEINGHFANSLGRNVIGCEFSSDYNRVR